MKFPNFYFKRRKRPGYLKSIFSNGRKFDGVIHLTGDEKWLLYSDSTHTFYTKLDSFLIENGKCTHYPSMTGASWFDTRNGIYLLHTASLIITDLNFDNVDDFKNYVKSEFNKGTPITVFYHLSVEV